MSFQRHGVDHLSVSSLNLWKNEPAAWVLRYGFKIEGEKGIAASRGTAVEAGVDAIVIADVSVEAATQIALDNFALNTEGEISDEIEKERAAIPGMIKKAAELFKPHGKPLSRQVKIEHWLPGIEVPVIGFIDYIFDDFLVDLKTTLRMPSEPRPDHITQVSLYAACRNVPPFLAYVTPSKAQSYGVTDAQREQGMWTLRRSALALQRVLSACASKEELVEMIVPKLDNYVWDDTTKKAALEIWR